MDNCKWCGDSFNDTENYGFCTYDCWNKAVTYGLPEEEEK